MSKFEVTTSQVRTVINDLSANNSEFKNRVGELQELQQELATEWKGEANTAFTTAFNNDKTQWDTFGTLVDQYIQALQSMMEKYDQGEAVNKETAATRSY